MTRAVREYRRGGWPGRATSAVLRLEVCSRDIQQFDIRSARNVTLDLLEHPPEAPVALGDDRHRDGRPLPLILVIDLGQRGTNYAWKSGEIQRGGMGINTYPEGEKGSEQEIAGR